MGSLATYVFNLPYPSLLKNDHVLKKVQRHCVGWRSDFIHLKWQMVSGEGIESPTYWLRVAPIGLAKRRNGQLARIAIGTKLLLMTFRVNTLMEITLLIQESYTIDRNPEVTGSLGLIAAGVVEEGEADRAQSLHTSSYGQHWAFRLSQYSIDNVT